MKSELTTFCLEKYNTLTLEVLTIAKDFAQHNGAMNIYTDDKHSL